LSYRVDGVDIAFSPTDFTQVNAEINREMINRVSAALDLTADDKVLDLFAGLGNFSLPLARAAGHVHGIEGSEDLVTRARENAAANSIDNASFACANLADSAEVAKIDMRGVTKLLLDPPRTGAEVIVDELDLGDVERIVYVSCNPVTLARDTKTLVVKHGFRLGAAGVMDMFPQTSHVESIAIFDRD
jgi:23S rRNA (uracil1939-C5)-methyltransferase